MRHTAWFLAAALMACAPSDEVVDNDVDDLDEYTLDLEPIGPDPEEVDSFAAGLVELPAFKEVVGDARVRLLYFDLDTTENDEGFLAPGSTFEATVFNYDTNEALKVVGDMEAPAGLTVAVTDERPAPTLDEIDDAVQIMLADDPELAARVEAGEVEIFRAMPPLLENEDGDRMMPIGVRETEDDPEDGREILGVNLSKRRVIHFADRTPPTSQITGFTCNPPPSAGQSGDSRGTSGWARLTLRRQGTEIWSMTITRPASSSGVDGSGLEVDDVRYKGKRMLTKGNLPILNVLYDGNTCGPYRDWQWQENPFEIGQVIQSPANGIVITTYAKTMRENNTDSGNFNGVAVYFDRTNREAVLMSELTAGWYRYMSEWRFGLDGTITPRFGFDAVQNYCTCQRHFHHGYWRLDFDLGGGSANTIEEFTSAGGWRTMTTEEQITRDDAADKHWRVKDEVTGDSVIVRLGGNQDQADSYGIADAWALRYHGNELDDASTRSGTQAGLPPFVNGESINNTNNVMWFAGHFLHDDSDPLANQTHTTQVTITPENW